MDCIRRRRASVGARKRTTRRHSPVWRPAHDPRRCSGVQRVQPVSATSGRHVQFDKRVTVHVLPYYDRRSPWMTVAADRFRFKRRILETEDILRPVLLHKLVDQLTGTFANVSVNDS